MFDVKVHEVSAYFHWFYNCYQGRVDYYDCVFILFSNVTRWR